jgi:predicted nuclease of predicted toxin-antitoxin system
MKLLLDECVPRRLKRDFDDYEISTIDEAGLKGLKNGSLIRAASDVFQVLITVDKNIEHQQNKKDLPISIVILSAKSNHYESLSPLTREALKVLETIKIGEIIKIEEHKIG